MFISEGVLIGPPGDQSPCSSGGACYPGFYSGGNICELSDRDGWGWKGLSEELRGPVGSIWRTQELLTCRAGPLRQSICDRVGVVCGRKSRWKEADEMKHFMPCLLWEFSKRIPSSIGTPELEDFPSCTAGHTQSQKD